VKQILLLLIVLSVVETSSAQNPSPQPSVQSTAYLGFDRNNYPGDETLAILHQSFSYTGYWLNQPPSARTNTWSGKRQKLQSAGFGFLVLFNGRLYNELKSVSNATKLGKTDAKAAVAATRREGFPAQTIIFLDQEQGGRMLPEQKAYIYAWVDGVNAGGFGSGIYCSGISAAKEGGEDIVTADDIRQNAGSRKISFWVANDACPPSPGCTVPTRVPNPAESGIDFADVWQFAQSPKRPHAASCPATYNADSNCYPPGIAFDKHLHIDVNTANSPDPSHGKTH
jgi:hypothetical protein